MYGWGHWGTDMIRWIIGGKSSAVHKIKTHTHTQSYIIGCILVEDVYEINSCMVHFVPHRPTVTISIVKFSTVHVLCFYCSCGRELFWGKNKEMGVP